MRGGTGRWAGAGRRPLRAYAQGACGVGDGSPFEKGRGLSKARAARGLECVAKPLVLAVQPFILTVQRFAFTLSTFRPLAQRGRVLGRVRRVRRPLIRHADVMPPAAFAFHGVLSKSH